MIVSWLVKKKEYCELNQHTENDMKIIAIGLGRFNSMVCFYDSSTQKPKFITAATRRDNLEQVLQNNDSDLVVMEACNASG